VNAIFGEIRAKLEKARLEFAKRDEADAYFEGLPDTSSRAWSRRSALALAIESVYTGIEGVLKTIASDIDGHVPQGQEWHARLLEVASIPIPEVRPAVLAPDTLRGLTALRELRHAVRNNYALDLTDEGVFANLGRVRTALPLFERDLAAFEAFMKGEAPRGG
jgi:hypothetical protein